MNPDAPFLTQVWQNSGPFAGASLILLTAMFLWMTLNMVEHLVRYGDVAWQSRSFLNASLSLMQQNKWQDVLALTKTHTRSHVAWVFSSGLAEFCSAREKVPVERAAEIASREARVAANRMLQQLQKGVSGLKAIALTAPFVGLFGTATRLLDWFDAYVGARQGFVLRTFWITAEALVPTVTGLFVGIIAVWWFNWRSARVERLDAQMRVASLDLLKHLKQHAIDSISYRRE